MAPHLVSTTLQILQIADDLRGSGVPEEVVQPWLTQAMRECLGDTSEPLHGFVPTKAPLTVPKTEDNSFQVISGTNPVFPEEKLVIMSQGKEGTVPKGFQDLEPKQPIRDGIVAKVQEKGISDPEPGTPTLVPKLVLKDGKLVEAVPGQPLEDQPTLGTPPEYPSPFASLPLEDAPAPPPESIVDQEVQKALADLEPLVEVTHKGVIKDGTVYLCVEEIMRDMGVPEEFITSGHQRGISRVALKSIKSKLLFRYILRAVNKSGSDVNHFGGPALDILRDVVTAWLASNRKAILKVNLTKQLADQQRFTQEIARQQYTNLQDVPTKVLSQELFGDKSEGIEKLFAQDHIS